MPTKTIVLMILLLLSGCSGVKVSEYRQEQPRLILEEYFNGTIDAWGMFQDRDGKVIKRFNVVIDAHWKGKQGVLDERFTYSDGTQQQRVWHIERTGDANYTGRADDVVGTASGEVSGNALRWLYTLRLPVNDAVYDVQFDDWMYLQEDGVMINRSSMKKFGFTLGEVTLFFRKRP
ncbi:MAG: DUF3833 domain-containing protein [Sedimenticola sp.]|nr:MAG: DUF3833 domain-containing protein [Sedimenticola sp.]